MSPGTPPPSTIVTGRGQEPEPAPTGDEPKVSEAGAAVGRYVLGPIVGEGGMGTVYRSTDPDTGRAVAVKVVRQAVWSPELAARFEVERQLLARMDHPNVARLFESGTTSDGQPYCVMELLTGVPLTRYCDERRLTVPERLALFGAVAAGVQHAHQKGVIHRDLKPSNILVVEIDGHPVPKIIDFGLAKGFGEARPGSDLTQTGLIVGTPAYMAPEQAGGRTADVDTRADVYALGAILYELLAGVTPIESAHTPFPEVMARLLYATPPRPSARLTGIAALAVAANRSTSPSKLRRLIAHDLDWVVLKALERDREHRYPSAAALSDDVQRVRKGEPASVAAPSRLRRLSVFVRRNQAATAAAGVAVLALMGGTVAATAGFVSATRAERLAQERFTEVEAAERVANDRLGATRVAEGLANERLSAVRAAERSASDQRDRAEKARAETARALADSEKARKYAESYARQLQGEIATFADTTRAYAPAVNGTDPKLSAAMRELGGLVAGSRLTPLGKIRTHSLVGNLLVNMNEFDAAERSFREALALTVELYGPAHERAGAYREKLATLLCLAERYADAVPVFEEHFRVLDANPAQERSTDLFARNNLATSYDRLGRTRDSARAFEDVVARSARLHGTDHPVTAKFRLSLAEALAKDGRPNEAVPHLHQCREVFVKDVPVTVYRDRAAALTLLGDMYADVGRPGDALSLFRDALAYRRKAAPNGWEVPYLTHRVGCCLGAQGQFAEAEPLVVKGYEAFRERVAEALTEPRFGLLDAQSRARVFAFYVAWGKPDEARKWAAPRPVAPPPRPAHSPVEW